ncbi:MAG: secondary thiamine-phosphate synthase enzyme YjbQ [Candidatus Woesearchaeota archaeon]
MKTLTYETNYGLHAITSDIESYVKETAVVSGMLCIFCPHTSCSLLLNECVDGSVQDDLLTWIEKHVPRIIENYTHQYEGDDDMPAHIKTMLTQSSLCIPIDNGKLVLGTWQGIFLWEHRTMQHNRKIHLKILSDTV